MRKTRNDIDQLAKGLLGGDRRALARLITLVESRDPNVVGALGELYNHAGRAFLLGITGPPGAGKSTLTDKLIAKYRSEGKTVGVVAIDPSSPFSGGALLGDRIRMMNHATDPDVFIRSLGSRGSYGGLSRATSEIVGLMDAFGFDVVIVETVGVGQTELDVMDLAHTVLVVFVPESGDVVQTMKAGLTEIADIFVVNKSDRPGADSMVRELSQMVEYDQNAAWRIPVLQTVAVRSEGVDSLFETIGRHREFLLSAKEDSHTLGKMRVRRLGEILAGMIGDRLADFQGLNGGLGALTQEVFEGKTNPYLAAQKILTEQNLILAFTSKPKDPR